MACYCKLAARLRSAFNLYTGGLHLLLVVVLLHTAHKIKQTCHYTRYRNNDAFSDVIAKWIYTVYSAPAVQVWVSVLHYSLSLLYRLKPCLYIPLDSINGAAYPLNSACILIPIRLTYGNRGCRLYARQAGFNVFSLTGLGYNSQLLQSNCTYIIGISPSRKFVQSSFLASSIRDLDRTHLSPVTGHQHITREFRFHYRMDAFL